MDITIRRARLPDVAKLVELTREFGQEGIMIPLSIGDTIERLRSFLVAQTPDGTIVGCVAVDATWEYLVEIRSLAVSRTLHAHGIGRILMRAALEDAREFGAKEVFTLTYVPEFFKRFGFALVPRDSLPHKVWLVCVKCPRFPDCGEVPMKLYLDEEAERDATRRKSLRSVYRQSGESEKQ
ncbi:MAG: N-acetyltransferase [Planctomycetaceae bacterium]|nr:N-acetyltransferase [Planctomycetaceae bacterium]